MYNQIPILSDMHHDSAILRQTEASHHSLLVPTFGSEASQARVKQASLSFSIISGDKLSWCATGRGSNLTVRKKREMVTSHFYNFRAAFVSCPERVNLMRESKMEGTYPQEIRTLPLDRHQVDMGTMPLL